MDRRHFIKISAAAAAMPAMISGQQGPIDKYESGTLSVRVVEALGRTTIYLTEKGKADYAVVQVFHFECCEGEDFAPITEHFQLTGFEQSFCVNLPLSKIAWIDVRELKLVDFNRWGDYKV